MTTKGEIARVRRQFFPFEIHNGKRCTEAGGASVHLFSSERGPALIRAAGANQEIDAGTLKKMFLHQLIRLLRRRRANERADFRRKR